MFHVALILIFVAVLAHDAGAARASGLSIGPVSALLAAFAPLAATLLGHWLATRFALRRFDAGDRAGAVRIVNASSTTLMVMVGAWAVASILWLGLIDSVRALIGDSLLIDELITTAPFIMALVGSWWFIYPIERRLRESIALRSLDRGEPVFTIPGRWRYFADRLRHQALIFIVPLYLIFAWSELVFLLAAWLDEQGRMPRWADLGIVVGAAQFLGVGLIFVFAPVLLRILWKTRPLPEGPVRERLDSLCRRQRIRFRGILEWRTSGEMINGAVIGLIAPLRYILLTDALLRHLPPEEIEAVLAHELGHVRRHHMPWLLICLAATFGLSFTIISRIIDEVTTALPVVVTTVGGAQGLDMITVLLSIVAGFFVFGFISRRFEQQADAFAVQHLSGMTPHNSDVTLTPEAASAMADALQSVARLNHIPRNRFGWRHGSIARRQRDIHRLAGRTAESLGIDRVVSRIKLAAAAALLGLLALGVVRSEPASVGVASAHFPDALSLTPRGGSGSSSSGVSARVLARELEPLRDNLFSRSISISASCDE